ncbi:MAG: radical SAM protein [Pseudomonadota bacterium]
MSKKIRRLLLIKPAFKNGLWGIDLFKMPPLSLVNIGSLVLENCPNWEVEFLDNDFEKINFNGNYDLVGITVSTSLANAAYSIADKFRSSGVSVILGGIHATFCFEEAKKHADCVVKGEAEEIFLQVLRDFENNKMHAFYDGGTIKDLSSIPKQRFELIAKYNYFVPNVIQATRGCPGKCAFCSAQKFNGSRVRYLPVDKVVENIKNVKKYGKSFFGQFGLFFADDNIFTNKEYAKELFKKITPLRIRWGAQCSLNIAKDQELLTMARKSGCRALLVGFESINQEALNEVNKGYSVHDYEKMIFNIHKAGIAVDASVIFGFENEDKNTIEKTVKYLIKNEIELAQFSILTPYPGSKLYDSQVKQSKIKIWDWNHYDQFHMVSKHHTWSIDELNDGLINAYRSFYSIRSIFKRMYKNFKRMNYHYGLISSKMNFQFRKFNPN